MKFMNKVIEVAKGKKVKALEEKQAVLMKEMLIDPTIEMTTEQQEEFDNMKAEWLELEMEKSKILGIRAVVGIGVVTVGALAISYGINTLLDESSECDSEEWVNYDYNPTVDFLTGSRSNNEIEM